MNMFSPADIIAVHQLLIARFGGMPGITEAGFGRLDGAAAMPLASAFGEELFPDVLSKAAALSYAIIRSHPFSDGNKRVALVVLDVLLTRNRFELTATNDDAYIAIMAAAKGSMSRDAFVEWVKTYSAER
jgi:death-on-curing protein